MIPAMQAPPFPVIMPDWQGVPDTVRAFCTTRVGGLSLAPYDGGNGRGGLNLGDHVGDEVQAVAGNRAILNSCLPSDVIFLSQVHGTMVCDADALCANAEADAVYARQSGKVCAVLTADCLPVLFSDSKGAVVAAAHAGWRGLAGGVLQNTVQEMRRAGAEQIIAWLGPAIGADRFEVGQDVVDAFDGCIKNPADCFRPKIVQGQAPKYDADIYGLARRILATAGVADIYGGQYCTVKEVDRFYSYRRDGATGRMASLIWIAA